MGALVLAVSPSVCDGGRITDSYNNLNYPVIPDMLFIINDC